MVRGNSGRPHDPTVPGRGAHVTAPLLLDARGRVALVTGASGGIGRAVAALLKVSGSAVAGLDVVTPTEVDLAFTGDACDEALVRDAAASVEARFGHIDYVVHAAGFARAARYDDLSLGEWHAVMDANVTSAFVVTKAAHAALVRSQGSVVLFSSTNGRTGGSELSGAAYAVAKSGIINLVRHLARAWAREGIRVNAIAPGPVATPMLDRFTDAEREALRQSIPLGRIATPEEIAASVAFLLSPHAAAMTGTCMNVSGGMVLD